MTEQLEIAFYLKYNPKTFSNVNRKVADYPKIGNESSKVSFSNTPNDYFILETLRDFSDYDNLIRPAFPGTHT